jgi:preprotein translocase subunit YajC
MTASTPSTRNVPGSAGAGILAALAAALLAATPVLAQQPAPGGWSSGIEIRGAIPDTPQPKPRPTAPPTQTAPPANTTVVPRTLVDPRTLGGVQNASVALHAVLTADGQRIDQGLVWRVFEAKPAADGQHRLVATSRDAGPTLRLAAGDYLVNAAFGRAHLTRKITLAANQNATEQFVLNAGGLRVSAFTGDGQPAPANSVTYEIYSDERDQSGARSKIVGGLKPGVIVRLNSGIYYIVSTLGDANATVQTDVAVEAGKLTEASVAHAASRVTLKLVQRAGGEALDTQWTITTPQGEIVKESVGALPTHTLAPGNYSVSAKQAGNVYKRDFVLKMGQATQVEVVMK